jgi:hypothetical protein
MNKRSKGKGSECTKRKKKGHAKAKSKRILKRVTEALIQKTSSAKKFLHNRD